VWSLCFQQICWAFLAFFLIRLLGCCFVHVEACLLYATGMYMYYWSARLMVVFFLLCWTVRPTSLFSICFLTNQQRRCLLGVCIQNCLCCIFFPFDGCWICALDSHLYLFGHLMLQFIFVLFMACPFDSGHSFICVYTVIKYITFSQKIS